MKINDENYCFNTSIDLREREKKPLKQIQKSFFMKKIKFRR